MTTYPICLPSGQFSNPRSYYAGLYVRHDPGTLSLVGNLLTFIVAGSPDAVVRVWFNENFIPWNTARKSLDHITIDASYEYPTGGEHRPLPFYVYWVIPPGHTRPHIGIDAMYGSEQSVIPLEAAPPGYWLSPAINP